MKTAVLVVDKAITEFQLVDDISGSLAIFRLTLANCATSESVLQVPIL